MAAEDILPVTRETPALPVEMEGHPLKPEESFAPMLQSAAVTPDYFRILQIPILRGRPFTETDNARSDEVVIVSASLAGHFWPGENPIGKRVRVVWDERWRKVIGVVGDVRQYDLDVATSDIGVLYMPYPQSVGLNRQLPSAMTILLRTGVDRAKVSGDIRRIVARLNPAVPVSEVKTMQAVVSAGASHSRALMWLFISFAAFALMLAASGIYGVVAYSTARRTFEMGVRVAVGATRGALLRLVLSQSLKWVLAGLAGGIFLSAVLARMLAAFLYGVAPTDPATYLIVAAVVVAVSVLAGYGPARRAATVNPVQALRVE